MEVPEGSHVQIKRVYEAPEASDGFRVLVDRLWPRGVSHDRAALDLWLKDVAPSPELRTQWNHDPVHFEEFAQRYREELDENPAARHLEELIQRERTATLIYAARDSKINHARVLRDYLAPGELST